MMIRLNQFIKRALFILIIPVLISCGQGYGKLIEYGSDELYYTSSVTVAEAYMLGDYLLEGEFFTNQGVSVQLNKVADTYEFRMIVKEGLDKDQDFIEIAKLMSAELSYDVFDDAQVDIHLCDEYFNTLRVVVLF